jgi:hypothetical protein
LWMAMFLRTSKTIEFSFSISSIGKTGYCSQLKKFHLYFFNFTHDENFLPLIFLCHYYQINIDSMAKHHIRIFFAQA